MKSADNNKRNYQFKTKATMKTKQQLINRVLLAIPVLRKKIVQRLKDNRNLAAKAAISCYQKKDWYHYGRYSSESIRYMNLINKIESKYES